MSNEDKIWILEIIEYALENIELDYLYDYENGETIYAINTMDARNIIYNELRKLKKGK